MHTVLGVASVLLALSGGYVLLSLLRYIKDWSQRRIVQFFLLTMPLITLGIGVGGLHDFVGHRCFVDILFWDSLLGVMLPLCMAAIACGACCWGIARWLFMARLIAQRGISIGPELQGVADRLSKKQKIPSPRVLLCLYDRPLAVTCGIFQPIILLSTWMVEHLDRQELEAVLAHELQHVARRDSLNASAS